MRIPRPLKRILPTNLLGRVMLILLVPIIVLQLLMAYVFYERHWDSVVRNMSSTTAADVAVLLREYQRSSDIEGVDSAYQRIWTIGQTLGIEAKFSARPNARVIDKKGSREFSAFYQSLSLRIHQPFMVTTPDGDNIRVSIATDGRVLELTMNRKRLASSTTYIFILWMLGSSLLLVTIAVLFLRNQVKPIVQLARAAEQFGLGQHVQNFTPRGASEIRRAGRAFLTMADRIRRQVQSRTEMLAGISHDLRTPLTRMKLEIEMGKIDAATSEALNADIDEMRRMIDEYLDFARGDASEPVEPMDIAALLANLCQQYARQGADVAFGESAPVTLMVRPQAMRRAIANLIENALRYGNGIARLSLEQSIAFVRIKVLDAGTGIPESEHETVFKPFTRLEPSRNINTGGVGLGLSIARDVAQSHGGDIALENQRDADGQVTGLEVTFRLPREVQTLDA
jgi:two-component system osmolarity sensor histidine kinase EnvZ